MPHSLRRSATRTIVDGGCAGDTVLYLGDTEVHLKTGTTSAWAQRYYTAAGTTIALRSTQTGKNTLTWLASDPHGTSSLAIDADTQAVTKRYTTAFGAPRTGSTGTWPDDKGFLGDPADPDSGLTYIDAREYDPNTGRFISVDPILDTSDPQSLNGYAYADNNPATDSDPTGQILRSGDGEDGNGNPIQSGATVCPSLKNPACPDYGSDAYGSNGGSNGGSGSGDATQSRLQPEMPERTRRVEMRIFGMRGGHQHPRMVPAQRSRMRADRERSSDQPDSGKPARRDVEYSRLLRLR
ncbi:RHS repeat-associated core domain-containing protein [Actinacidiphila yeochonensis]|uniref:RHS repeat-associated core domain-containing protein n=1 Tax=Actinacidiphila yeochonensis TaxID=89050 RepID=UPI003898EF01